MPTLALMACLVQVALATTASFGVNAGDVESRTLGLAAEDHVLVHFTVTGGQFEGTVGFSITCPNQTVNSFGRVGVLEYRFVCTDEGDYILHFSNEGQSENKFITLNYEIQHYILGFPQMLFLAMVVVVFCVGAVAVFILSGKQHSRL